MIDKINVPSRKPEQIPPKEPSLLEKLRQIDLAILIEEHKNLLVSGIVLVLVCIVSLAFWIQHRSTESAKDYVLADKYAVKLQSISNVFVPEEDTAGASEATTDIFYELKAIVDKNPILHKRYTGLIAQELLLRNEIQQALPYADEAINELKAVRLPEYAQFCISTLLIEQGKYDEAYKEIVALAASPKVQSQLLLYAFTLLTKASLEHALNKKESMAKTVEELKLAVNYGSTTIESMGTVSSDNSAALFLAYLQEKNFTLLDYMTQVSK